MKHVIRITLVLALVIIVARGCVATSITTSLSPNGETGPQDEIVLPTQTCGDYFIVQAMINDTGPFPMLLDTGAGTTVISPQVAKASGGISKRIKSIHIDRFTAKGRIPCKVQGIDHISRALGIEIEGILAYGVFKGALLTYDYPKQEIRIRMGGFSDAELARPGVVPTSKGKTPYINASTGSQEFTVLLDTGSSRSLTLKKLKRFAFENPPCPTGARMRINGLFIVETARLDGDLTLGPLTLHRPIIHNSVSVNLAGQGILRNFIVTFDQVNHRVRFTRPDESLGTPIEIPSLYGMGFALAPRDDRLIVRKIFRNTPAFNSDLRVDDEILSIDGTPIADRGCEHLEYKPQTGPEAVELVVERNGESITITMVTAVLVP